MRIFKIGALAAIAMLSFACEDDNKDNKEVVVNEVVLDTEASVLTVINIMKPTQENQDLALETLSEGLTNTMSKQPGFVSSSLHKSLDNHYIINYAQWESGEYLQAASELVGSGGAPKMAEAFGMTGPDYHPFALTAQYKSGMYKPVIDQDGEVLTVINILTPAEGVTQAELAAMLKEAVQEEVLPQAGFISSTIHESMDNNYIINYAQWENQAALEGMVARVQSGDAPKLGAAFGSAMPDYHPFQVVEAFISNKIYEVLCFKYIKYEK